MVLLNCWAQRSRKLGQLSLAGRLRCLKEHLSPSSNAASHVAAATHQNTALSSQNPQQCSYSLPLLPGIPHKGEGDRLFLLEAAVHGMHYTPVTEG